MLRERWARQNKRDSRLARDNGQPFTIRVNLKVRYRNFQLQTEAPTHYFHIQTEAGVRTMCGNDIAHIVTNTCL